ncbi:MAG: LD-carboxypeptidase [Lachnospiraceae bacterium]|nr:LD-carboxypeptidase [Lachnospiraceae bacterium]
MIYPEFLHSGGRIGFIAPSYGCATEPYKSDFEEALEYFKSIGFRTVTGPNCFAELGTGISNTPEKCAEEAYDFLVNDRSDVIISCGGGELMCEILPYLDFDEIKKADPKWFMGYSDNTNLTFLLNTLCDRASIYSLCSSKFSPGNWHECTGDAFDLLCGKKQKASNYPFWRKSVPEVTECDGSAALDESYDLYVNKKTEEKYYLIPYKQYIYSGEHPAGSAHFSGRLTGGCLDILVTLVGTKFDRTMEFAEKYCDDGIIWFIESCDLSVMSMRRALWQMENAGWFKHVKGFLIGRPARFDDSFDGMDHYNAVTGILGKYNVPIIMDLDIGHLFPQMPIISGACADVSADGNSFSMKYDLS